MSIYMIRHGQTTGDLEDRYGGCYDDGLSDEGLRQAATLAEELAGRGIVRVVTSRLLRARQTGDILARALGVDARVDEGLHERDQYAALSGMVKAEAKRLHPEWVDMLKDRLSVIPGAEPYPAFSQRLVEAFARCATKNTAIVWHGGGMRVLFRDILKLGELAEIGDCCWVELKGPSFEVGDMRRLVRS